MINLDYIFINSDFNLLLAISFSLSVCNIYRYPQIKAWTTAFLKLVASLFQIGIA